jgi:hypothetical protein
MSYVIKADGEREKFDIKKIEKSVLEAGASAELARETVKKIQKEKYENISTEKILDVTLKSLKKNRGVARRYDLKRAIMQLGPTGFPFEKYFSLVLKEHGYDVWVGTTLNGQYITHEIDVIAKKNKKFMIECKYHNQIGIKTRSKVPLYVYARFLDVKKHGFDHPWVATNTKCTNDVINYAKGVNMRITAWDYPEEHSLKRLITNNKLYPITVLGGISRITKEKLFGKNIFLIKSLVETDFNILIKITGFKDQYLHRIVSEAREILGAK